MENGPHINIFDFDETLFRVPGYTCSEAKGMEPYQWFDSPESLSKKFNIRGIANTIERTGDDCLNYLVTHRVKECESAVLDLLAEYNIRFDKTYFLGRGSDKAETVIDLIRTVGAESITIFEDSLWEIIQYTSYFLDIGLNIKVDFVFIDKSRVIKINLASAKSLAEFAESERLKLL
jgi:hypothetical protein